MKDTKFLFDESKTPEGMISVSQIQTYLSCPKKWAYNYIDNITPRVDRAYLTIGKLCHKGMQVAMRLLWRCPDSTFDQLLQAGLEAMYNEGEAYVDGVDLLPEELPDIQQMRNDAAEVFAQALEEFNPTKYEVYTVHRNGKPCPALELHFRVPCAPTGGLHGYIDAVLKDKETGFVWCVDYKFRRSLSPDEEEAFNIQNAVYSYACAKMGVSITGTMTWQHVNIPAADPAILKNGTASRAKIKTTWKHYERFLIDHDLNPDEYREEMEEKLADIEWCRPTYEYRNPETVNRIWKTCVLPVASKIRKAHNPKTVNHPSLYPWNCKMCQYQSLCQAELRDYDVDAIRQREYTKRERNTSPKPSEASLLASNTQDGFEEG